MVVDYLQIQNKACASLCVSATIPDKSSWDTWAGSRIPHPPLINVGKYRVCSNKKRKNHPIINIVSGGRGELARCPNLFVRDCSPPRIWFLSLRIHQGLSPPWFITRRGISNQIPHPLWVVIKGPAPGKTKFIKFPPFRVGEDVKYLWYARGDV